MCSFEFSHFYWVVVHLISSLLWDICTWIYGCICALAFGMDKNCKRIWGINYLSRKQPKGESNIILSSASLKTVSPFSCNHSSIHPDHVSAADHSRDDDFDTLAFLQLTPKLHLLQVPWCSILTDHDHATSKFSSSGVQLLAFLNITFSRTYKFLKIIRHIKTIWSW